MTGDYALIAINDFQFWVFNFFGNVFHLCVYAEIVESVKQQSRPPFRPIVVLEQCIDEAILNLMQKCWADDPPTRPDFSSLKPIIRKLNK